MKTFSKDLRAGDWIVSQIYPYRALFLYLFTAKIANAFDAENNLVCVIFANDNWTLETKNLSIPVDKALIL